MRKYLLLAISCCLATAVLIAQSNIAINSNYTAIEGTSGAELTCYATILNNSPNDIKVKMLRIENYTVAGSSNYFCWDVCYGPSVGESIGGLNVTGYGSLNAFSGYHYSDIDGESSITYCFFNENDMADSSCITMKYQHGVTAIDNNIDFSVNSVSEPSPNPARAITKLNYILGNEVSKGELVLNDLLGNEINRVQLNTGKGTIVLNTSGLKAGIYLYSMLADGKSVATKKLVVAED